MLGGTRCRNRRADRVVNVLRGVRGTLEECAIVGGSRLLLFKRVLHGGHCQTALVCLLARKQSRLCIHT